MRRYVWAYLSGVFFFTFVFLIFFLGTHYVILSFDLFGDLLEAVLFSFNSFVFIGMTFFAPLLISFISTRFFMQWLEKRNDLRLNWIPRNKRAQFLLLFLYALTVAFGIPAIQNANTQWAVDQYKKIDTADNWRIMESHPHISTAVAIPVLPFIILTFHQYQLDALYGWGGWEIQFWYFWGEMNLLQYTVWFS